MKFGISKRISIEDEFNPNNRYQEMSRIMINEYFNVPFKKLPRRVVKLNNRE